MKLILFGPQGAGKGTVGALLSEKYGLPLLGAGQMLRQAVKQGTEVGKLAEEHMNKGELVPDKVIADIIKEKVRQDECKNGYILDGFPRTAEQAELFKEEMEKIDFLIELDAPETLLIHRLTGRRQCRECGAVFNIFPDCDPNPKDVHKCDECGGELYQRDDDTEDAIKKRLEIYHKETEPTLEKYGDRVIKIDATGTPDIILKRIVDAIEKENQ